MKEFDQFITAPLHSNAQKLPLYTPDNKETKHYLMIVGVDSDKVRRAKSELMRAAALLVKDGKYEKLKEDELKNKLIASHVESWSFKTECTEENILKFFKDSPYVADAVDAFAANHENYIKKK